MKFFTFFLGINSGYSQTTGSFYEEMTKFKAGLSERPQTYRKIVVSVASSGSCSGECPSRFWVRILRGISMRNIIFIISNQTPSKEKFLPTRWLSPMPNHIVKTWERNFPYHRRLTVLKNSRMRSSGLVFILLLNYFWIIICLDSINKWHGWARLAWSNRWRNWRNF